MRMRETPFLMWSNFKPMNDPQPLTSPVFLVPLLLDQIGAQLPPYYQLLLDLHEQVPAMRAGQLYDGEGKRLDPDELSPEARQLLHDYRLVQYDLSVGQRWSQDAMFYPRGPARHRPRHQPRASSRASAAEATARAPALVTSRTTA